MSAILPFDNNLRQASKVPTPAGMLARYVGRSRALASLLPAFVFSGVMTLVVTAAAQLSRAGAAPDFLPSWVESWLIAWPIAFPVAYLMGPLMARMAGAAPAIRQPRTPGLGVAAIADACARTDARHGLVARRPLKDPRTSF